MDEKELKFSEWLLRERRTIFLAIFCACLPFILQICYSSYPNNNLNDNKDQNTLIHAISRHSIEYIITICNIIFEVILTFSFV
jgi:hypothetical protein